MGVNDDVLCCALVREPGTMARRFGTDTPRNIFFAAYLRQ